jgi:arylsulfatase A-like enzyme
MEPWIRASFSLSLFLTALLIAGGCGGEADRPNVILLVMDTTRGDRCSVNGYERPTTPALEEIGRGGVIFRNAWSPSAWTGPAHASLFTGLRPENHGFRIANRTGDLRCAVFCS